MHPPISEYAKPKVNTKHQNVVDQAKAAIEQNDVVVLGMAWNPHVKRARKALDAAKVPHTYLEFGNYAGDWQKRLAIKMWSQWSTFPQVFHKGALIGGADETEKALAAGALTES